MKTKSVKIVSIFIMLLWLIGCGEDSSTTSNSQINGTKVTIAFKSKEGETLQKVSEIHHISISVKKDNTFLYEGKRLTKTDGKWGIKLNLNTKDGPYLLKTRAYNAGGELLYKGVLQTTETLPTNLMVTLDAVISDSSFALLPSLKKIETSFLDSTIKSEDTKKQIRMKFTIVNLQSDNVNYSLSAKREATNVKGQLEEVSDAGSFTPSLGALNFTDKNEVILESIYTQPLNPPTESTTTDIFSGADKDFITTRLILTNSKGDEITIPFTLPSYEEQDISIHFPPEIQKVDVLDEGTDHKVELILTEASSTFTYEWEVLTGSTIVGSTATQNPLKLEDYDITKNGSLCVRVKVSDTQGASTKVGYCLHGKGFVKEGNIVRDVVREVQWQDDEAVKTNSRAWLEIDENNIYQGFDPLTGKYTPTGDTALPYCEALELDGYLDWRVPTKKELKTIVDKRFDPTIAETFTNIGVSTAKNPNIYYTTANPTVFLDEHGMYKDMLPFSQNLIDDNWDSYYAPKDKIYVRCIRDKNITISNLEDIYGALKLTTSLDKQIYNQTDTIERLYTFTNESNHILNIPENTTFTPPFYTIGTLQFLIERLGSDSNIPSIPSNVGRSGNKYGADGFRISVSNNVINPLSIVKSSSFNYSFNNYPKGNYRMYVEYKKVDGSLIETQSLDFTIE